MQRISKKIFRFALFIAPVSLFTLLGSFQPLTASPDYERSVLEHDHHVASHWSYHGVDGPEHWALLQPEFRKCENGTQQSPINIQAVHRTHHSDSLAFNYQTVPATIVHADHTTQATYPAGSALMYDGRSYQLKQFHFHHPSEHQLHSISYPMEIHLVHQDETGHILVVGILVAYGQKNFALEPWSNHIPQQSGEMIKRGRMNAKNLLPEAHHHYTYHGSLTTPPCSEGVQWVILQTPTTFPERQIEQFTQAIGNNARPIQALYGRTVNSYGQSAWRF